MARTKQTERRGPHFRERALKRTIETPASSSQQPPAVITSDFLDGGDTKLPGLALVLLNWKLPPQTVPFIKKASLVLCADGGANRLYDELPTMFPNDPPEAVRARFLPHSIRGDLDSIRKEVFEFYAGHAVPIEDLSHDQMSTDLDKCVMYIKEHFMAEEGNVESGRASSSTPEGELPARIDTIIALGALGGRLDHILSNISTLYSFRDIQLVLCGDGNLTRLLRAGRTIIRPNLDVEGPTCGLVPMDGPAVATTQGLRWNMTRMAMRFGGLISTSNIIDEGAVVVESDSDLVWTTELRHRPPLDPEGAF